MKIWIAIFVYGFLRPVFEGFLILYLSIANEKPRQMKVNTYMC